MGFSDNIFKFTGGICPPPFRVTVCGNSGAFVEGVLKIIDINDKSIILRVKGYRLKFIGESLKISSYYERDIAITGEIIRIEKEKEK